MSKSIVMSVLFSIALSIGGWLVSCGNRGDSSSRPGVAVQLPPGCMLLSPRDQLGSITSGSQRALAGPGVVHFVLDCSGREFDIDREIKPGQSSVTFEADDLR